MSNLVSINKIQTSHTRMIEKLEEEEQPGLLLFADFEKAFDSISHDFMFNCLKCFNFGPDTIKWVKCFYNDVKS